MNTASKHFNHDLDTCLMDYINRGSKGDYFTANQFSLLTGFNQVVIQDKLTELFDKGVLIRQGINFKLKNPESLKKVIMSRLVDEYSSVKPDTVKLYGVTTTAIKAVFDQLVIDGVLEVDPWSSGQYRLVIG